jgi:hypothetical protein
MNRRAFIVTVAGAAVAPKAPSALHDLGEIIARKAAEIEAAGLCQWSYNKVAEFDFYYTAREVEAART